MAFWCEAKERPNIDRFPEPFFIVQRRDVRQGDDRTYSGYGHQSARQITFARDGPYLLVQRVSGVNPGAKRVRFPERYWPVFGFNRALARVLFI